MNWGELRPNWLVVGFLLACSGSFTAACDVGTVDRGDDDGGGSGGGGDTGDDGSGDGSDDGGGPVVPPGVGDGAAVARGDVFFGTRERFNRYYTDPEWVPLATIYASPGGGGDGSSADTPTTLPQAAAMVEPGTRVDLAAGTYDDICIELDDDTSGTYDQPIVFAGQRAQNGALAVRINCCDGDRTSCFNIEAADYVALDSVELVGGSFGLRAVGADFAADRHQVGIAVLRSSGHDQRNDPFFTGQSDWFVIEGVTAHGAGEDDGHGIYLSNGGDWQIVRDCELYENLSSDFQINADPELTCDDIESPECDAVAGEHPTGGRGVTDFALVERNYFHDGLAQGANFTSVRNSLVRNNVFAVYEAHGVSFWQETDNPRLGSRGNRVLQNLFVTANGSHAVQFINSSTDNTFAQNVLLGVSLGNAPTANPDGLLLEVDGSVDGNVYTRNAYIGGTLDGREPGRDELRVDDLDPAWFAAFPVGLQHAVDGFAPTAAAPWIDAGEVLTDSPADMQGTRRIDPTPLGPLAP